ncbi:MAG: hypothetical protein WA746_27240 [Isosphaeraceae bacterium]
MDGFGKALRSVDVRLCNFSSSVVVFVEWLARRKAIFRDGIGDKSRDSDPSSISLIPSRQGSRSSIQAEHVIKPMPRDCVGCHNRGTRRGHDHAAADGCTRNRQIVDDPA